MLDHFFREGLPLYDLESFDKPNEYTLDIEEQPEMHTMINLKEALICFAVSQNSASLEKTTKTIACQSTLEFEFMKGKILDIKKELWEKIKKQSQIPDKASKPTQLPLTWMRF